jgi:hypothetical protein
VGALRRARLLTFTEYRGIDGAGVVSSGGAGVAGNDGTAAFWATGAWGAEGAVSTLGGEVAGVCPEAGGEGGGTISRGGPELMLKRKTNSRTTMTKPVPMKMHRTQGKSFRTLAGAVKLGPDIPIRLALHLWQISCWGATLMRQLGQKRSSSSGLGR